MTKRESGRVGVPPAVSRVSRDTPRVESHATRNDVWCVPRDAEHGGRDAHPTRRHSARIAAALLVCFVAAFGGGAHAQVFGGGPGGERKHVQARLVADADAITPGKPFDVGVVLKMEPG